MSPREVSTIKSKNYLQYQQQIYYWNHHQSYQNPYQHLEAYSEYHKILEIKCSEFSSCLRKRLCFLIRNCKYKESDMLIGKISKKAK